MGYALSLRKKNAACAGKLGLLGLKIIYRYEDVGPGSHRVNFLVLGAPGPKPAPNWLFPKSNRRCREMVPEKVGVVIVPFFSGSIRATRTRVGAPGSWEQRDETPLGSARAAAV